MIYRTQHLLINLLLMEKIEVRKIDPIYILNLTETDAERTQADNDDRESSNINCWTLDSFYSVTTVAIDVVKL